MKKKTPPTTPKRSAQRAERSASARPTPSRARRVELSSTPRPSHARRVAPSETSGASSSRKASVAKPASALKPARRVDRVAEKPKATTTPSKRVDRSTALHPKKKNSIEDKKVSSAEINVKTPRKAADEAPRLGLIGRRKATAAAQASDAGKARTPKGLALSASNAKKDKGTAPKVSRPVITRKAHGLSPALSKETAARREKSALKKSKSDSLPSLMASAERLEGKPSSVPGKTSSDKTGRTQSARKQTTPKKTKSPAKRTPIQNKFSLNPEEQPEPTTRQRSKNASADAAAKSSGDHTKGISGTGDETPDVVINKRMTKGKLALLSRSPLADVLSQKDKDAAAEELYGKGAKYRGGRVKRHLDSAADDGSILLDPKEPPSKKHRSEEPEDRAALKARRKEARKIKRQVRQMKARGELRDGEKEFQEPGVVYLGHIPHGFYEKEMRGYFSQYGTVTRVRLSRSKRTARSRGFAFIEFADKEVAAAAAGSMDGYIMHGQALVAKVVPPENVHPDTFKGANKTFKKIPFSAIERRKMIQRSKDPIKLAERSRGVQKKCKQRQNRLARAGLTYDFPSLASIGEDQDVEPEKETTEASS